MTLIGGSLDTMTLPGQWYSSEHETILSRIKDIMTSLTKALICYSIKSLTQRKKNDELLQIDANFLWCKLVTKNRVLSNGTALAFGASGVPVNKPDPGCSRVRISTKV